MTITAAIDDYIRTVSQSRAQSTARAYQNGLRLFSQVLRGNWIEPDTTPAGELPESAITWLLTELKDYAPATERLYCSSVVGFYNYLAGENLASINLPRVQGLVKRRARRRGVRLPHFPGGDVEKIIQAADEWTQERDPENPAVQLRGFRDRAFILTLADTGLRIHELCNLTRGDLDWKNGQAVIVGKGDKQAVIRFSRRSLRALKSYLELRQALDGKQNQPLNTLPVFTRHDPGAGKRIKGITTAGARKIVGERVLCVFGEKKDITPHTFRHYFVTKVLKRSGNLKLAQELARHSNIQVTQRYAHLSDSELDAGYLEIFDE